MDHAVQTQDMATTWRAWFNQPRPQFDSGPKAEMAGRRRAFQSNPELQQFLIPDVRPTGKQLGVGSYGSVEELEMNGLVCAGKRLHDALLQRDNAGVPNLERKYIEECQVMPTGYWEKIMSVGFLFVNVFN